MPGHGQLLAILAVGAMILAGIELLSFKFNRQQRKLEEILDARYSFGQIENDASTANRLKCGGLAGSL
jgi:hypothetical protein